MNTWRDKHPGIEYIFWNESEIIERGMIFECQEKIDSMEEINGKADIMRWEILRQYGGIFLDADSVCLSPLDDTLWDTEGFAAFENEQVREGLVATGTMGFVPGHPLCVDAVEHILANPVSQAATGGKRAWQTVGPLLLTQLLRKNRYNNMTLFPSHFFLPIHYQGLAYAGHGKVYAHQEWGSTKQSYDTMNEVVGVEGANLDPRLLEPAPENWISLLVPCYNTSLSYMYDCLNSVVKQQGHFGIELVWVNDGSTPEHSALQRQVLDQFAAQTRFVRVVYHAHPTNRGLANALNTGLSLCTCEYVFRLDADDMLVPDRLAKQWAFLKANTDVVLCGTQCVLFMENDRKEKVRLSATNHAEVVTWEGYQTNPQPWIMNGNSLAFRKEAVLEVGGYDPVRVLDEDRDLELRLLEKWGRVYNLNEPLVLYRIHPEQATQKLRAEK